MGIHQAYFRNSERPVSSELVKFTRQEQMRRLKHFLAGQECSALILLHRQSAMATIEPFTSSHSSSDQKGSAHATQSVLERPHISVCICTYKRAKSSTVLTYKALEQDTGGLFTYSIVIVDNHCLRSAGPVVAAFAEASPLEVRYVVELRQSISLARNMALKHGKGDFIAFIDDDEFPPPTWLKKLFTECTERHVDGVLGPVKPRYEAQPPRWVVAGGFYDRQSYPTGLVIDGTKGRTGNVLFKRAILDGEFEPFRPEFRTGEDQDFFFPSDDLERVCLHLVQ